MSVAVGLGIRLKAIREFYGWSQRELAKRAGVPNSAISMIEQGAVSPTIQSLEKVLKGFPMTVGDFFSINLQLFSENIQHDEAGERASVLSAQFTGSSNGWNMRFFQREPNDPPLNVIARGRALILLLEGNAMYRSIAGDHQLRRGSSVSLSAGTPFRIEPLNGIASWVIASSPSS